jgi:hypothetical protein
LWLYTACTNSMVVPAVALRLPMQWHAVKDSRSGGGAQLDFRGGGGGNAEEPLPPRKPEQGQ